jgi:hypothetical protein
LAVNKDVLIKVKSQYENAGLSTLKSALKQTQADMNALRVAGQQNSQAWNDLKTKAGYLANEIKGLGREFRGLDKNVKMSGMQLFELFENATVVTAGLVASFSAVKQTISEFLDEFNKLQSAKLGLESIAKFKGIDQDTAVNSVKNLELVKNGLLNIGDASLSLKNLLASGFSLDQSIELIKRFGDAAAFGRQSSLEFGYAISSATEGIKNQNSTLVDNAGVTKNLSLMLEEAGFSAKDLGKVSTDVKIRMALYNGILKETNGQLGDASKLTNTFAGQQASLNATILTIKQRFGELLSQAIQPFFNFLKDGNGNFSHTIIIFGGMITVVGQLIPVIAALRIAFQGLQLSMGWIGVIGLAVAGLVTGLGYLATKLDETSHKIEDLDDRIKTANDNTKKYGKTVSDVTTILKGYHAEVNNTKLNTTEQNEYNNALIRLKEINPGLVDQIRARSLSEEQLKFQLEGVTQEMQNLYDANIQILESNKNLKIAELKTDFEDATKELNSLNKEFEYYNQMLQNGSRTEYYQVYDIAVQGYKNVGREIKLTAQEIVDLKLKQDSVISKLGQGQAKLKSIISDIVKTHIVGKDVSKEWSNVVSTFADRLKFLGLKTGDLINVFRQLGATGVASIFGISGEMLNNAKISQSLAKAWSLFTAGKYEEAKNEFLNTLKQASEYKPKGINTGSSDKKKGKSEEEKMTTDLSRLQEELKNTRDEFELLKKELTAQGVQWDENTISIREYLDAIHDLEIKIEFKKLNLKDLKLPDIATLPGFDNSKEIKTIEVPIEITTRIQEQDRKKAEENREAIINSEQYQNTLMVFNSMGDALRNSLNSAWEDTFGEANSLFEQFMQNVTQALINSLITKAISGILNLIFPGSGIAVDAIAGRAKGGEVRAGTPYMIGEEGAELMVPEMNGRILSHRDTMNALSSYNTQKAVSNQPTVIEKYFALEQDGLRFLEKNYPSYRSKRLFRQL